MISIIIPVYNAENYLKRCLDSVFAQQYTDYEVIAINDGSSDASLEKLKEYEKVHPNLHVLSQANSGQAVARNAGIEVAKGEWILFVDSDDEIEDDYLQSLYDKAMEEPCDLVVSRIKRVYTGKTPFIAKHFSYIHSTNLSHPTKPSDEPTLLTEIMSGPIAKLIRRSFITAHAIRFAPGLLYEDLYFTQALLLCDPKVTSLDKEGYIYYIRSNSSMTKSTNHIYDMFEIFERILAFAEEKQVKDKYHSELEYLAFYHIAIGTMYRLFQYQPVHFFAHRKRCSDWLKEHHFSRKNPYLEKCSGMIRLYLAAFFS